MTRPWLTLPPMLADYARAARLLHLTTAELRGVNSMPPAEERCWRTTPQGRYWQAEVQAMVARADASFAPALGAWRRDGGDSIAARQEEAS